MTEQGCLEVNAPKHLGICEKPAADSQVTDWCRKPTSFLGRSNWLFTPTSALTRLAARSATATKTISASGR